jgi:hypothetical protein
MVENMVLRRIFGLKRRSREDGKMWVMRSFIICIPQHI